MKRNKPNLIVVGILFLSALIFIMLLRVAHYGSIKGAIQGCEYTEENFLIPENLQGKSLELISETYVVEDPLIPQDCGGELSNVRKSFVNKLILENNSHGAEVFARLGKKVFPYEGSSVFEIHSITALRKHGFASFGGRGTIYSLTVTDEVGDLYRVDSVYLTAFKEIKAYGFLSFKYVDELSHEKILTWDHLTDDL